MFLAFTVFFMYILYILMLSLTVIVNEQNIMLRLIIFFLFQQIPELWNMNTKK